MTMRRSQVALVIVTALAFGCRKNVPEAPPRSTAFQPASLSSSNQSPTHAFDRGTLVTDREPPPPEFDTPPVFGSPMPPRQRPGGGPPAVADRSMQRPTPPTTLAGPRPNVPPKRGTLVISIYGTPLDFILDSLVLRNGAFCLTGQGMRFVGRMSANWRGALGKSSKIEPEIAGVGASEMELPQIGAVKITAGQLVLDEVIDGKSHRVRGRLVIVLPGPEGPSSFAGTFEVGVVVE